MLELKVLEMDFLKLINYNVFISKEIFEKYCYYLNETLKY